MKIIGVVTTNLESIFPQGNRVYETLRRFPCQRQCVKGMRPSSRSGLDNSRAPPEETIRDVSCGPFENAMCMISLRSGFGETAEKMADAVEEFGGFAGPAPFVAVGGHATGGVGI